MQIGKKLLSLLLTLVMLFTTLCFFSPDFGVEANAAGNTVYGYKVYFDNIGSGNTSSSSFSLLLRSSNGTGEDKEVIIKSYGNEDGNGFCKTDVTETGTLDDYPGYFPYAVKTFVASKFGASIKYKVYLSVYNYNTGTYSEICGGNEYEPDGGPTAGCDENYEEIEVADTTHFPYVNSLTVSDASEVIIPDTGADVTRQVTLTAVDQYGVEWENAPSNVTANNGVNVSSATVKKPTLTFHDAGADYAATVSATYTNSSTAANNSGSSTRTSNAIQVKVPRYVTFDKLFNYDQWKKAGFAPNTATVSDITDTGFTVTANAGANDGNSGWSPKFELKPNTTYTLIADTNFIPANTGNTFDAYFQPFTSAGATLTGTTPVEGCHVEGDIYISSSGNANTVRQIRMVFTTTADTAYGYIRFDANIAGSKLTVNNIRLIENDWVDMGIAPDKSHITVAFDKNFNDYNKDIPVLTKTGYTFLGWYHGNDLWYNSNGEWVYGGLSAVKDYFNGKSNYSVPLTSKWIENQYTIKYDANGGDGSMAAETKMYTDANFTLAKNTFSRTGYTFTGWNTKSDGTGISYTDEEKIAQALSDKNNDTITFYAQWSINRYTITWRDDIGNLIGTTTVDHGETPTHADPTKASTPEYTYTFTGWTPELEPATGAATYTASFKGEKNKYTITWLDDDGSVIDTTAVEYGAVPTHADPTKEADEQYSYTFNGWTPALKAVTGEATYQATYKSTVNKYTVTWIGDNNEVLKTEEVEYGTVPSYTGDTPEKQGNDQYSYTFSGWDNPIVKVTGPATYTAQFDSSVNKYTVEWLDGDGNVLLSEHVEYGKTPSYSGSIPTKTATDQYTYEFNGTWSPEIDKVTGPATYTAQFKSTVNKYTVTWVDDNNAVLETDTNVEYGTMPSFDRELPTKVSNQQYSFTFAGWAPEVSKVTGNVTYKATYKTEERKYTVEWVDGDGKVIKTDEVAYGDTPAYEGYTPTKTDTDQYTYEFNGTWSPEIVEVTGPATYTAQFKSTVNEYTVTWVDDNNAVLETDENVPYGTMPSFDRELPTKVSNQEYSFTFAGWSPEVSEVTGNVTYTATYVGTVKSYKVTWKNYDGADIKTDDVLYGVTPEYKGETPVRPADEQKTYTFSGWTPEISVVTSDAEYTATYTSAPREYTVTFKFANGNTEEKIYVYGTLAEAIECPENTTREPDAENHYSYEWPEMYDVTEDVTYEEIETKTAHNFIKGDLARPVFNDGVWSDGYYTYTCSVGDAPHPKTEPVKRADYTEYTEALNKLKELLDEDGLNSDEKAVINKVIADNAIVDNLIESEQATVDEATAKLKVAFEEMSLRLVKFTVKFVVNGNIVKEEKVIEGKNATAPADPAGYYDDVNHYTFTGWDKTFTNVETDLVVNAVFEEDEHEFTTHTDKDDTHHIDKCECGYTKDVEHSYDDGEVTKAPTCSATGKRTKTCTLCGGEKIVVEPIDENAHEAAAEYIVTLAPTCSAKGKATYNCVYCDEVISTIELDIVPDAHSWETEYTVDAKASCFAPGSKSYHCEYCTGINEDSKVDIAQRTHNIVDVDVHTEATCIATGIMNQKCNNEASDEYEACTHTTTRVIEKDPDNHTTDETYVDGYKAPTCTTPGATGDTKHKCCNAVKIESVEIQVDENAHTGKADLIKNYKAATCYSEGYTGDIYWSCCEKLYAEGKVTEKTAHTSADAVIENKILATATKAGSYEEVIYCSVAACHFEISRTLKTYTIYDVLPGLPESGKLSIDLDENGESKENLDDILRADANYKTLYNEITVDAEGKLEAEDDCEVVITVTATTGETVDITVTVRTPKTITFIMKDKTVTLTAYNGDRLTNAQIPTVESIETEEFTYTFKSWSPVITVVADDTTYTAIYTEPCDYDEFDRLSGIFNEIIGGLVDDSVLESNKEIIDELLIEIAQINDGRKTRDESEQPVVDAVVEKLDELVISIYPDAGSALEIIGSSMHYLGTVIDLKVMKMPLGTLVTDAEWTSSDENVVFFSDGKLYAFGTGTATLTATKGLLTVSKKITVVAGGNTRSINFTAVDLTVTFLIEGFRPFYDTTLLYWSNDTELRFRINVHANPVFRNHVVYFNDEEVFPDENSYYVIPAGSGDIRVVVAGELYEDPGEEKDPVTKWSLWDWILDFFRKIGDFFRNLFN